MYVKLITIILLINLLKTLAALSVDKNQSEYYYMQEGEVTSLARWKFLATICQGILAICSGTVISEYWVLSATSCFEEKYKNISQQFYLRTGVAVGITEQIIQYVPDVIKNLSHTQITDATLFYGTVPEEKIIPIARIILHESFLSKYADIEINQNDIALIKVVRKLTGNGVDAMSAAKTPPIRYANCRTVGWAPTVDDPGIYGLHEIDLTLLPSQSGLKTLVFLNEIKVRNLLHNKLMTESRTGKIYFIKVFETLVKTLQKHV